MLAVVVQLPAWSTSGDIDFLVDTGASRTVLHPADAYRLRVPFDDLVPAEHARAWGTGGVAAYAEEPASLRFVDAGRPFDLDFRIWIALPDPYNVRLPSLLGRDVLQYFRLTVDLREPLVTLDVADELARFAPYA